MGFSHLPELTFPFSLWTHCSHHLSSCCTCSSLAWFAHLWKAKLSPAYSKYFCLILFLCLLLTPRLPCACRDLSRAQFPPHLQWLSHPSCPPEPHFPFWDPESVSFPGVVSLAQLKQYWTTCQHIQQRSKIPSFHTDVSEGLFCPSRSAHFMSHLLQFYFISVKPEGNEMAGTCFKCQPH